MAKKIKLNGAVIGDGDAWIYNWLGIPSISPSSVAESLESANGDEVEIYINSTGGSAWSGSEIYTALKEYPGKVTVKIPSIAASAASIIAMSGDKVLIAPTGQIMIHNSAIYTDGNKGVHQQRTQMLESIDEGMMNAYISKTGKSREEIRVMMDNETFLNAQQAVELGFADEIMFNAEEVSPVASISNGYELSPEIIDKLRTELKGTIDTQVVSTVKPSADTTVTAQKNEPIITKNKEDNEKMDINELKEKHPELFSQIVAQGQSAERERINALNNLAKAPGASEIVAKAIESGQSVADATLAYATSCANKVTNEGKDRLADAVASKAVEVTPQDPVTPELTKEAEDAQANAEAAEVVAEMKRLRGGK